MAYTPATNLTTTVGFDHLATVYYERTGLDILRKKTIMSMLADPSVQALPQGNGKTVQMFRMGQFASSTTPKTEGTVGTGLSMSSATISATVAQYADFLTFSDMLVDTAINPMVESGVTELSYRAALMVDDIIKAEVDSAATSVALLDSFFSVKDLAHVATLFQGVDAQPFSNGVFPCIAHPYVTFDLINDPAMGGFLSLVTPDSSAQGADRLNSREDRGFVLQKHGVAVHESTNVTVNAAATPDTHNIYYAANQGLGIIDLAGRGPSRVQDPKTQRFNIAVGNSLGPDKADPEGVIRSFASFNFVFVAKALDGGTRLKKTAATSSIIST